MKKCTILSSAGRFKGPPGPLNYTDLMCFAQTASARVRAFFNECVPVSLSQLPSAGQLITL